jgi:hypothetical protein
MRAESDYRLLLESAQEAVEQIDMLLAAVRTAPQADSSTLSKAAQISERMRSIEADLEQLWDQFKRLKLNK